MCDFRPVQYNCIQKFFGLAQVPKVAAYPFTFSSMMIIGIMPKTSIGLEQHDP